jgi:cytochrome P450
MSDVSTGEATSDARVEFDPFSNVFFDDPYDMYRRLRDEAPVYHNERYGFWALSRYDDVVEAHKDWRTFSAATASTCTPCRHRPNRWPCSAASS